MVRTEPTADAWFAAMRARSKFGIAMAAMIKIMATTISNSISEKPFWFFFIDFSLLEKIRSELLCIPGGVQPSTLQARCHDGHAKLLSQHTSLTPCRASRYNANRAHLFRAANSILPQPREK